MTASAPATYIWKVVNTDTGLPGKQMIGVSRPSRPTGVEPTPCGPPGCWATWWKPASVPNVRRTTSKAPAEMPPAVITRSASGAPSSARRSSAGVSPVRR